ALGGRYQYAYADRKEEESAFNTLGVCASGTSPYRNLDLNATYYFGNDTSQKHENIYLGREKLDADFVDFYLEVKAKRMRLLGFRGGFIAYKSFIRDNEGTIGFKGHLITEPDSRVLDMVGEYSTMMETNNYYIGISCLQISDWLAEVEKYGIKEYRRRTELYADIIYSPAILYYNITAHGTQNSISFREYNVNEYTSRSRFGARFGFTRWSLKKAGIGFGIEAGVRPGPSAGLMYNSYIGLRGSLNIAKRI
ncbi:MAG TPA: hypothetical protein VM187_08635, partial [Niastella sp.]|nr:hypothetical protein [Niastella sp.]